MPNPTQSTEVERFSTAVIEAVAERAGVDPVDLDPPLYRAIDPDALDELLASLETGNADGSVSFVYFGFDITVHGNGTVVLDDGEDPIGDSDSS